MAVHSPQVEQSERAQKKQEAVSEVEIGVAVENKEEHKSLDKNERGAHIANQGIVFVVDSHLFDSLGVPFQLSKLNNVFIVHFWREYHCTCILKAKNEPCKEEQQAESISHDSESFAWISDQI